MIAAVLAVLLAPAPSAAFNDLMKEAVHELTDKASNDPAYMRPWHSRTWLQPEAPGAAGRLALLCNGGVEPKPDVGQGNWTPTSVDVSRLTPAQKSEVKMFMTQVFVATHACGTIFAEQQIAADALKQVQPCATKPEFVRRAYIDYLARRPAAAARTDLAKVAAEALREVDRCG